MKIPEKYREKIDPFTEEALAYAREDEALFAILNLELQNPLVEEPFHPKDFSSYLEYRQALLEYLKREYAESLGDTRQELKSIGLQFNEETLGRLLVVQGTAPKILQALEMSGVRHATIDQLFGLPYVAPLEAVRRIAALYQETLWPEQSPEERSKRLIEQASEQYLLQYNRQHNKLQILGMQRPVDLESIYTAVRLLPREQIRYFESVQSLEAAYRQSLGRSFEDRDCPRRSGIEVANNNQFLMVLGQPGSGKTTFLRKVGLEAMKINTGEFRHSCLPVFLELK